MRDIKRCCEMLRNVERWWQTLRDVDRRLEMLKDVERLSKHYSSNIFLYRLGKTNPSTTTPQHAWPVIRLVWPNLYVMYVIQHYGWDQNTESTDTVYLVKINLPLNIILLFYSIILRLHTLLNIHAYCYHISLQS